MTARPPKEVDSETGVADPNIWQGVVINYRSVQVERSRCVIAAQLIGSDLLPNRVIVPRGQMDHASRRSQEGHRATQRQLRAVRGGEFDHCAALERRRR